WRGRNLATGIRNLLNYRDNEELFRGIYSHALFQSLYRDRSKLPSYIPPRTFALALLDSVVPAGSAARNSLDGMRGAVREAAAQKVIDKQVSDTLLVLIDDAENAIKETVTDVGKARTAFSLVQERVETWFNDSMERVAGWYKRKTQALTFALALVFTFALNVDSIMITKRLSSDTTLRAAVIGAAEKSAQPPSAVVVAPASGAPAPRPTTGPERVGGRPPARARAPLPPTRPSSRTKRRSNPWACLSGGRIARTGRRGKAGRSIGTGSRR